MGKCICPAVDLTEYGYFWRRHLRQKLMDATGYVYFTDVQQAIFTAILPLPECIIVNDGMCGKLFYPNDDLEFDCGCTMRKAHYYLVLFMTILYDYPDFACKHGTHYWDWNHLYEAHSFARMYLKNILK